MTTEQRVGEVIMADTTGFTAQCYELYDLPPLGSLVKTALGEMTVYAVVSGGGTASIEPGRRPLARGKDEASEEDIFRAEGDGGCAGQSIVEFQGFPYAAPPHAEQGVVAEHRESLLIRDETGGAGGRLAGDDALRLGEKRRRGEKEPNGDHRGGENHRASSPVDREEHRRRGEHPQDASDRIGVKIRKGGGETGDENRRPRGPGKRRGEKTEGKTEGGG